MGIMGNPGAARLAWAAGLAWSLSACGQTVSVLLYQGQQVGSVGQVTTIDNLAVNDSGHWIVEVDTNNPVTTADSMMVMDGAMYLREDQSLAAPTGATIGFFDSVNLNASGHSGWNFELRNTVPSDQGLYFDTTLVLRRGTISTASGFSPNTPYLAFSEAAINDSNQILVCARVDDPGIPNATNFAMVRVDYNAAAGMYSEVVLSKQGELVPELGGGITDFATARETMAISNNGDAVFVALVGNYGGVFRANGSGRWTLAADGGASPIPGRSWRSMAAGSVDLNNAGDWVLCGTLEGDFATAAIIVKNNQKVVQQGDAPPGIPPPPGGGAWRLTSFGSSVYKPVQMSDRGEVLWFGDWDDPSTFSDTALFVNEKPILRKG